MEYPYFVCRGHIIPKATPDITVIADIYDLVGRVLQGFLFNTRIYFTFCLYIQAHHSKCFQGEAFMKCAIIPICIIYLEGLEGQTSCHHRQDAVVRAFPSTTERSPLQQI